MYENIIVLHHGEPRLMAKCHCGAIVLLDNRAKHDRWHTGDGDAPSCQHCGAIMLRKGSCYCCPECGNTSGCS